MHDDAEFGEERGLDEECLVGRPGVRRVGHVEVVRLVAGHELVAAHAVQHGVHDRPRGRGRPRTALRFGGGQRDRRGAAQVDVQRAALHEDPAPDDLAGLAHALDRRSAEREVDRVLPPADGVRISGGEV